MILMKGFVDLVQFSDLKEISESAKGLGIGTIILALQFKNPPEISALKSQAQSLETKFLFCHVASGNDANEMNKFKGKADLVCVRGGTIPANKFGVTHKHSDFLLEPCTFGQNAFDAGTAQTAFENKKPVAFTFSQFLEARQLQQSFLFANSLLASKLCRKFNCQALLFSGARSPEEMRSPRNLSSFAELLGFPPLQARQMCIEGPKTLLR